MAALDMVSKLKKERWLVHSTEFRSHLCFGLCDVSHAFFEPKCMHVLGQMVRAVFPTWRGSCIQFWTWIPPSCHSSGSMIVPDSGQGKSPVPGKTQDKRFYWKCWIAVSATQVCSTEQDVRSRSCLNLTHPLFPKGCILVHEVTPSS